MSEKKFKEELKKLGINITLKQEQQLKEYYDLILEWNKKINLTTITKKNQVYLKHFYDSITICKIINLNEVNNLCDIGTGAGFPGIIIKIFFPNIKITLIDSLNKRINFLKIVQEKLNLKDIEIIHIRAEEYAKNNREKFDVVTSRAVSNLSNLMEYSIPLVKKDKFFIPMKGNIAQEIIDSKNAVNKLNIKLCKKEEFLLPEENSKRTILKYQKENITPLKYPRKYSEMKKNPL